MADAKTPVEVFSAVLKDVVAALRDSVLFLLFLLLLFAPDTINNRLKAAGFTKGSIGGLEWEAQVKTAAEQTKSVGQSIEQANASYDQLITRLSELEKKVNDPTVKSEVKAIGNAAEQSRSDLAAADKVVKRSLAVQQQVVAEIAPSSVADSGWVYLGKVNEDKTAWAAGSPQTIQAVPLPLADGMRLSIVDDTYLRKDSTTNSRSSAPILGVAKVGESLELLDTDYSHAKGGGWFIWAKVQRVN